MDYYTTNPDNCHVVCRIDEISSKMEERMAMLSNLHIFSTKECLALMYYISSIMGHSGCQDMLDSLIQRQLNFCETLVTNMETFGFVEF